MIRKFAKLKGDPQNFHQNAFYTQMLPDPLFFQKFELNLNLHQ